MARMLLEVFLGFVLLTEATIADASADTFESACHTNGIDEPGHMMLQAKTSARTVSHHTREDCPLPTDAIWCEVRLKNVLPYSMAVYQGDDVVSAHVCLNGFWEENDMSEFGVPGDMLDIGGNIGYHTFAFAAAGWNVSTFEPMAPNQALLNATMCRNPALAAKIHINYHGLGTSSEQCKMISPEHNKGDGFVKCGDAPTLTGLDETGFKEIGQFSIRRLDEVLVEQNITKVDLVKIDVEGYEGQVFHGAPNFLIQYHPRIVKSEIWANMFNATGNEYLTMFETAGYKFFKDIKCQTPYADPDPRSALLVGAVDLFACKQ